jgi:hypothetical protein
MPSAGSSVKWGMRSSPSLPTSAYAAPRGRRPRGERFIVQTWNGDLIIKGRACNTCQQPILDSLQILSGRSLPGFGKVLRLICFFFALLLFLLLLRCSHTANFKQLTTRHGGSLQVKSHSANCTNKFLATTAYLPTHVPDITNIF